MVTKLGMSDVLGLRAFGNDHGEVFLGRDFSSSQDYSDETASKIDAEIHSIISEAYATAKKLLTDNIAKLHFISEFLVKNEVMDAEQFAAAMDGDPTFEDLEEMTEAKKRKSREENDRRRAEMQAEERKRREAEEKARRESQRNDDANRYNRDGDPNSNGDIGPDGKKDDDNNGNIPF
jgi:cell division protease FtsH